MVGLYSRKKTKSKTRQGQHWFLISGLGSSWLMTSAVGHCNTLSTPPADSLNQRILNALIRYIDSHLDAIKLVVIKSQYEQVPTTGQGFD